jgi:DUF971 family protein
MSQSEPWPTDLSFDRTRKVLNVAFDDGAAFEIPFELLRVESPSAEVQGHSPSQKQLVRDKAEVNVRSAEPVGRYAVRIAFDDGHDSGLFTWPYLHKLGREKDSLLRAYHKALKAK